MLYLSSGPLIWNCFSYKPYANLNTPCLDKYLLLHFWSISTSLENQNCLWSLSVFTLCTLLLCQMIGSSTIIWLGILSHDWCSHNHMTFNPFTWLVFKASHDHMITNPSTWLVLPQSHDFWSFHMIGSPTITWLLLFYLIGPYSRYCLLISIDKKLHQKWSCQRSSSYFK